LTFDLAVTLKRHEGRFVQEREQVRLPIGRAESTVDRQNHPISIGTSRISDRRIDFEFVGGTDSLGKNRYESKPRWTWFYSVAISVPESAKARGCRYRHHTLWKRRPPLCHPEQPTCCGK
jgi:hypothetical protein